MNFEKKTSPDDDVCVVCYRNVEIYSIGECDHPVCYECSTRMRVLCSKQECPICRKIINKAIFTYVVKPFVSIVTRDMKSERKYSIFFENDDVMKSYDNLLHHKCPYCSHPPTETFDHLKEHVRKVHEKFYCDLCIANLKIFTHERRCYTRTQLGFHRRKGDVDDTSHKGHPLCQFCDQRFMDKDELFRHLRRDHYYCHFCDADGVRQFYEDYDALREHFKADHFLCEEGDCQNEKFTSVFRNKIDLQGHIAELHLQNASRQASRQARTLDIEFTVNHHRPEYEPRGGRGRGRGRGGGRGRGRDQESIPERLSPNLPSQSPTLPPQTSIDINCSQDFPSLNGKGPGPGGGSGGGAGKSIAHKLATQNRFTVRTSNVQSPMEEEFPSLASTTSVTVSTASGASNVYNNPSTSVHLHVNTKKSNGVGHNGKGANVSITYNHKGPKNDTKSNNLMVKNGKSFNKSIEDDFPALKVSSSNISPIDSWVSASQETKRIPTVPYQKKKENHNGYSAPSFSSSSGDFPSLSNQANKQINYSGRSSVTIPVSNAWTHSVDHVPKPSENNLASSKNKKKKKNHLSRPENDNRQNSHTKPSKKKPLGLSNIFDNSDGEDSPQIDLSAGRLGDYESVAPSTTSNVTLISAESLNPKKTESRPVSYTPKFSVDAESDFPSLSSNSIPSVNSSWKPKKEKSNKKKGKVANAVTPFQSTDMTFTSSSGEQFAISPTGETSSNKVYGTFTPPPNFEERNKHLIQTISQECGGKDKFNLFKELAQLLRGGTLHGRDYYVDCSEVIGKTTFHKILPELLGLLPDIKKQQEILEAYRDIDGGRGCSRQFTECRLCCQVTTEEDFANHMESHNVEGSDFPSLACVSSIMLK